MNNAEAKFILQGYRPNGADAGDPTFGAAIEQAGKDPALGEWFAREQAFDRAISAKLEQIMPPADLRAAILAGGRVTAAGAGAARRSWWMHPVWLGAAASVAILLALALALWPRSAVAFESFAVADARNSAVHGGHGHETGELQAMLNNPATPLTGKLPIDYAALHDKGCRMVQFEGRDVLEICFNRNGVWFHCYIARAADFPRLAISAVPTVAELGGAALASWTDGEHLLVVVSKTGRKNLEGLL
jgi:hypothetical protein